MHGRRALGDGDVLRVGHTAVLVRMPAQRHERPDAPGVAVRPAGPAVRPASGGCSRRSAGRAWRPGGPHPPASNEQIAGELHLSVDAVKAHLRQLFRRFDIEHLPQIQKRTALVRITIESGILRSGGGEGEPRPHLGSVAVRGAGGRVDGAMSEELLLTAVRARVEPPATPSACAGCFAEDGVAGVARRSTARVTAGREAIRDEIALVMEAVPDLEVAILAAGYASDRRLWTEWRVEGTRTPRRGSGACVGPRRVGVPPQQRRVPRGAALLGLGVRRLSAADPRVRTGGDRGAVCRRAPGPSPQAVTPLAPDDRGGPSCGEPGPEGRPARGPLYPIPQRFEAWQPVLRRC